MGHLRIASNGKPAARGNFGADVAGTTLFLSPEVVSALKSHGVMTAEEFVSYVQTFPTAIAEDLDWDVSDVQRGLAILTSQLRGLIPDDMLDPKDVRGRRPYGALDPRLIGRQKA